LGPRVLLVEDDDDSRELMAELLASAGCTVQAARTGQDGLRLLGVGPVDVVVTDVGLPGMGGLELALMVKSTAPGTPVILVTGWSAGDLEGARRPEVEEVLVKPVAGDALVGAVVRAAARRAGGASDPPP
jgi:CheY-like chemotaxis protein